MRLIALLALCCLSLTGVAQARDLVHVAGSASALKHARSVADRLTADGGFPPPRLDAMSTGQAFRQMCAGIGSQYPDAVIAPRRITQAEFEACAQARIDLVELLFGSDGIVIAHTASRERMDFSVDDVYKAFGRQIVVSGKLTGNPYKTWKDVDGSLPYGEIEVLAPPLSSSLVTAFLETAMEAGAGTISELNELRNMTDPEQARAKAVSLGASEECRYAATAGGGPAAYACITHTVRTDGAWTNAGTNKYAIVQTLVQVPTAVSIFNLAFVEENSDKIQAASIDGVVPTTQTLASGEYPIAGNQYLYVKKQHIKDVPGLQEFAEEFVSERAIGKNGYVTGADLMPLPAEQRMLMRTRADRLTSLSQSCVRDVARCDR